MSLKYNLSPASALLLSAFSASMAGAQEAKLPVIQSLTGSPAFIGRGIADGIKLAIEGFTAKGLAGEGVTIWYTLDDNAGEPSQALSLIEKYAADPSVLAIIGPTTGAIASSVAAAANDNKVPAFIQANSATVLHAGAWSNSFSRLGSFVAPRFAEYAVKTRNVKNCAVLTTGGSTVKDVPIVVGDGPFNFTPDRYATFGMGILKVKDGAFARADDLEPNVNG